jgi:hypothetical protein
MPPEHLTRRFGLHVQNGLVLFCSDATDRGDAQAGSLGTLQRIRPRGSPRSADWVNGKCLRAARGENNGTAAAAAAAAASATTGQDDDVIMRAC